MIHAHDQGAPWLRPRRADLLALTQWLSPAFPVSAYAYSHGLEAAISSGAVTDDGASVAAGSPPCSRRAAGGPTRSSWRPLAPGADLEALSDMARALASSAERWEETRAQGAAFAATRRAMGADQRRPALSARRGRGRACAVACRGRRGRALSSGLRGRARLGRRALRAARPGGGAAHPRRLAAAHRRRWRGPPWLCAPEDVIGRAGRRGLRRGSRGDGT
jgi:hypothetical protein